MSAYVGVQRTKGAAVHPSVARGLEKLGADIAHARRSRRLTSEELAERMGVSRGTVRRLEGGDPGVALNTLAMALVSLGMLDRLVDLVDQATDDIGLMTARENVGKRVVRVRKKTIASGFRGSASPVGASRPPSEPKSSGLKSSGLNSSGPKLSGPDSPGLKSSGRGASEPEGW